MRKARDGSEDAAAAGQEQANETDGFQVSDVRVERQRKDILAGRLRERNFGHRSTHQYGECSSASSSPIT
jgi:hypothetical protein